jgi:cytochrome d ubiquinol oxidase subunit II
LFAIDGLTLLCAAAVAFSILTYVLLDGTDLGVGLLMGFNPRAEHRQAMVLSILPIWDANETWLVLGAGALLAMFPPAYAILLPALYLPLTVMLLALIVRAVALEFREHIVNKRAMDALLLGGSLLASFFQGVVLGALVQGVPSAAGQYTGNGWEWLAPFPLFCGLALVVGYLWLGACWLYWRTTGALQHRSGCQARVLAVVTVVMLVIFLIAAAALDEHYARHLSQPWLAGPAALMLGVLLAVFHSAFRSRWHCLPLIMALAVTALAFALMAVAVFPMAIPPHLTLGDAAAAPTTQTFMLVGFAIIMPITLAYNTVGFRVFAGKIMP